MRKLITSEEELKKQFSSGVIEFYDYETGNPLNSNEVYLVKPLARFGTPAGELHLFQDHWGRKVMSAGFLFDNNVRAFHEAGQPFQGIIYQSIKQLPILSPKDAEYHFFN